MSYIELFGVRKLKCPKCNHCQTFHTGGYPEYFLEDFSVKERTCESCNKHIWKHPDKNVQFTDEWNLTEIINVISDEFENQNKHNRVNEPFTLLRILKSKNIPINIIKDILVEFFNDLLN